jgi:4-hydroxy-tetrahydrodipicolinate reductase
MAYNLKVALIGYGKMGRMIESIAARRQLEISAIFDINNKFSIDSTDPNTIKEIEVLLDFSTAESVRNSVITSAHFGKKLVIGTTGWYDQMKEIRQLVEEKNAGVIYGSNFAIGMNLFFKIANHAAELFSAFDEYDSYIDETHHKMKKDSPSGTAKSLWDIMKTHYGNYQDINSIRAGFIPGDHSVHFDSEFDHVLLKHSARNRLGFSEGAILAAKWIRDKSGFFNFQQTIDDILDKRSKKIKV